MDGICETESEENDVLPDRRSISGMLVKLKINDKTDSPLTGVERNFRRFPFYD